LKRGRSRSGSRSGSLTIQARKPRPVQTGAIEQVERTIVVAGCYHAGFTGGAYSLAVV